MIKLTEETEEGRKVTKLNLNVTWMDNNGILSCRPGKSEDSWQIRNITLSVEHAPRETKVTVSSEDVKKGDSVTLSCTSRGRPDVSFTWFKNEKIEESQKMSDLKLINVKPEDSGEYYCEAKNDYGAEESNKIKIDVKYGPQGVKVQRLDNINDLKEGDKLTLKCSVQKANPAVYQFMWYKNDQTQRETSETFIINNVSADDRGSYHCEADNGIKTAKSDEVSVTVMYSPRIKMEGANSVKVGTTLTLTCSADADPQPHMYTWKHTPGLPSLSFPMNNKELKINKVTTQHAGQYTCDVTNTIGTGSDTIKVDVLYPPSNFKLTMKREVREFEVISIICTVQSFPQSVITVTGPQGDLTSIQSKRRNSTESANSLSVNLNVTESDAGMYTCKAENQQGENETKQKLTVLHAPKNVTASITGEQTFGNELTLTCEAHSKHGPSSFEWKKLVNGQLKTVGHEQRLHLYFLEVSDSGQYVCIVQNSIGNTESLSVEIKVKYAPNINIVHNMTIFTQWNWKLPVSLTCSADAYPPVTVYKWYKQGENTKVVSHQQHFTVWPQDQGNYYCSAANDIGISRSKHIMLFNPPSNFNLTMKREVREFEVISIICTVQSFPQSVITVTGPQGNLTSIQSKRRNSTASANALSVYLNVTESDAGMYTCKAENQEGENETKQELTVLHAPKNVTASVTGEQTFGRELTLTCAARANPAQLSYEWKKRFNGQLKAVRQSHEQRLHFLSLEISDSGQYVCIAKNNIGKTESPSVEIKVKYAPNINIVHNMTTLTQGNWEIPVSLTCSADAYPPATVYNWYREEDNMTVLSDHQNFTVQPQNPGMYYCTANNAIGKSRSKNIMLFISSNSLKVFYQIIFPIILLLILIVVAFILMRRTIIKARSDQQREANLSRFFPVLLSRSSTVSNLLLLGSRNNTQGNLSVEDIADPSYGRVNQSRPTTHSQDADLNPRPNSNIHTVYAAIKLPKMKEAKKSPKQQKTGYMDTDTPTSTLNYVTLDFKGQNKPEKRVPESSAVYAVVSKNKQTTITQSDHDDYENVSSAHVPKVPFINMDWESDTSEEDEVNYSTVSCSAKPAVKDTKPIQKSHLSSSSSDDEDRTTYSDIKT
ncbi:hypothetical protein Q8A67_018036 [Cirrhinus molitorella]|uniref:Ig-like domain-containing protein n=1 Tax=Cirrhinus molitorella TaxID=172907 RepID=A0AA88TH02_9TELE|nr:hypothetical protein Q8A67_018036 [Cirrhinus molitorella]